LTREKRKRIEDGVRFGSVWFGLGLMQGIYQKKKKRKKKTEKKPKKKLKTKPLN
jgi:hypothetical protein